MPFSTLPILKKHLLMKPKKKGYDGVICGHIHRPIIKNINGMLYCNDGDWVESMSALVETYSGELKIVYWMQCGN